MDNVVDRPKLGSAYQIVVELRSDLHVAHRGDVLSVRRGADQVNVDLEGRLHRAWLDGDGLARSFDGSMRRVHIERPSADERHFEVDTFSRAGREAIYARVADMLADAQATLPTDIDSDIADLLERAAGWDAARYEAEAERFKGVYTSIPLLPPDQVLALVVQPSSWQPQTITAHVDQVRAFIGRALALRRGVFLSGDGFWQVSHAERQAALDALATELDDRDRWPFAVFVSAGAVTSTAGELAALAQAGLRSATALLASGDVSVRKAMGTPGTAADTVEFMHDLRAAGIRRGVVAHVGGAAPEATASHTEATVQAIVDMGFEEGERVYLSPVAGATIEARQSGRAEAEELKNALREAGIEAAIAEGDIYRFTY